MVGGRWAWAALWILGSACSSGVASGIIPYPVDATGRVFSWICEGAGDVEVRVFEREQATSTDALGSFSLAGIPGESAFQLSGAGYVSTITTRRLFLGHADLLFPLLTQRDFDLAVLFADEPIDPELGIVAIAVGVPGLLPIADATARLEPYGQGGAAHDAVYLRFSEAGYPEFVGEGTQPGIGTAVFFNVPPGEYYVRIDRDGYAFPRAIAPVRAGQLTADIILTEGEGGVSAPRFYGDLTAQPPFPAGGAAAPLAGATLTFESEIPEHTLAVQTDAAGHYDLTFPNAFERFDLTIEAPGYGPLRYARFCALAQERELSYGGLADRTRRLLDFMPGLGSAPVDPSAAQLEVRIGFTEVDGVFRQAAGAVPAIDPPVAAPAYEPPSTGRTCAVVSDCTTGCPAGSRCAAGQCVLGDTGPMCERCAPAGSCPMGFRPMLLYSPPAFFDCFCLAEIDDCAVGGCPARTFCEASVQGSEDETAIVNSCTPYPTPPAYATYGQAYFTNLPPGIYRVTATAPGALFYPVEVRLTPGAIALVGVGWTPE